MGNVVRSVVTVRGEYFSFRYSIFSVIIQILALVFISQSAAATLSEQQVEKNCKAFLYCENEMMSIHKRCTQHSRQMTIQLCHLNQEFKNLSELMDRRVDEFRVCVLDKNLDLQVDEDMEEQCGTLTQFPIPDPKLGCWQAVQTVRLHCQQLQKCCPNANTCLKQLKDSELTKSVRNKHIEINHKTLKCRAQMQDKMVKRRNSTDAIQSDNEVSETLNQPVVTNGVRTALPGSNAKGIYAAPRANVFLSGVVAPPLPAFQPNIVASQLKNDPADDSFGSSLLTHQRYPAVRIRQLKNFRLNPQPTNVDIVDITKESKESLPDNSDSISSIMNDEPKSLEGGKLEPLPPPAHAFRSFMSSMKPPTTDESEALLFTTILAKSFSETTMETPSHSFPLKSSIEEVEEKNVLSTTSSIKSEVVSPTNTNVSATRFVVPQYASTLRPIRLRKIQKISTRVPTSEYIYKAALLRQQTRDLRHQRMRELARLYASSVPQSRQVKVVDESGGSFARKNEVINLTFISDSIPQRVVFPGKVNAANSLSPRTEPEIKAIKAVLGKSVAAKLTPRFTIQAPHWPTLTTTEEPSTTTTIEETVVNTSVLPTTSSLSLVPVYKSSLTDLNSTPRSHAVSRQPLSLKAETYKTSEPVSTTVTSTTSATTVVFQTESAVTPSINVPIDATDALKALSTTEFTPLLPEHAVLANRLSAKTISDAVYLQKLAQLRKISLLRARAAQRVLPALRRHRVHGLPTLRQSSVAKHLPPKFSSGENERVGIFNEPEAVDPDSVPALLLQQQHESHVIPKTLNFTRLRLFAARPHFAQSKLDRMQTEKNLQTLLSSGKFHPLGRKVLSEPPATTSTTAPTFTPEVVQPRMLSTLPAPSDTANVASQTKMIHSTLLPGSTFRRLHGVKLSSFDHGLLTSLNTASVSPKPMDEKLIVEQQHESGYASDFTASTISSHEPYWKEETSTVIPLTTTISELKSVFEQTSEIEKIENGEAVSENNGEWSSTTGQHQSSETDTTVLHRFVPTAKPFYNAEEPIINNNSEPTLNIDNRNNKLTDIVQKEALSASPFEMGDADFHSSTTSSPPVFEHRAVSLMREWPSADVQPLGYSYNEQFTSTSTTTEFPIIGEEESASLHDGAVIFKDKMMPVVESDTAVRLVYGGEIATILPPTSTMTVESSFVTGSTEAPSTYDTNEEGTYFLNDIRRHPQLSEQGSESATTVVDLPYTSEIIQQQFDAKITTVMPEIFIIDSDAFNSGSEVYTSPIPFEMPLQQDKRSSLHIHSLTNTPNAIGSTVLINENLQQQQQQQLRLQSDVNDSSVKAPPNNKNSALHDQQQLRNNMNTLAAIMVRKQRLQRIHQSSRSSSVSSNGDAASGYRNKVLSARRKLISSQVTTAPQLPLDVNKANSSGEFVLVTPGYVAGPGNEIERTTIISSLRRNELSESDVRRAPSSRLFTLPPPPHLLEQLSSVDVSKKAEDAEEMSITKRILVLNLEKFLRMRKEEIRVKIEGNFEVQRLTLLRRPKTEFESKQQVSGYCELYSICIDQMKFVQRRCAEEHKELGGGDGRLLPGLPKRRFGACNTKLLLHYQRVDAVRSDLEESVETCLIDKIATKSAEVLVSCPAEWPLLPAFETEFTTCSQKVVTIQNHCKKLGRCCTSLNKCRKSVESFALARRLRLEEERLNRRAAECQLSAHEEYKQLRQEIQDRQAAQIDSTLLSETATTNGNVDVGTELMGARAARKREILYSRQPTTQFSASESAGSGFFALQPSDLRNSRFLM